MNSDNFINCSKCKVQVPIDVSNCPVCGADIKILSSPDSSVKLKRILIAYLFSSYIVAFIVVLFESISQHTFNVENITSFIIGPFYLPFLIVGFIVFVLSIILFGSDFTAAVKYYGVNIIITYSILIIFFWIVSYFVLKFKKNNKVKKRI